MEIDALQYSPAEDKPGPLQSRLKIAAAADIVDLKKERLPLAYVIKAAALDIFRNYPDLIEDKGIKHKSIQLSRILLGRNKIPIVDGRNYSSSSQLNRSVNQHLSNAEKERDNNLYILGVPEALFNDLFQSASKLSHAKINPRPSQTYADNCFGDIKFPDSIMRLMKELPVSEDLEKNYLGKSKEAEFVRQLILLAAENNAPVLIVGDTGTGKEIAAQEIHKHSDRNKREFVPVNCGAITHTLFESELFGHVKGAFTDAKDAKKGLWKEADKGTLFLDEIGELPLDLQAKILRALQEHDQEKHPEQKQKIRPVGSETEIPVDARIIAATNRDLFSMVQSGAFREDLYYRLRGFYIPTPSLRDHPDDIPLLAQCFWKKITPENGPLPQDILAKLREYRWPGNARELKAVLNQLNAMFPTEANLGVDHLLAIFDLQGQSSGHKADAKAKPRQIQPCTMIECLRHLRRVYETIRATEVAVAPLTKHGRKDYKSIPTITSALTYRLDELGMLCRYPLRFHKETTFVRVTALRSKLFYLFNLLASGDMDTALSNWEENVLEEFKATLSAVEEEIKRLKLEKNF